MESGTHFVSGRISAFKRRSNITQRNLDHSQLAEAFLIPSALRYVSSALSGKYLLDLVIVPANQFNLPIYANYTGRGAELKSSVFGKKGMPDTPEAEGD